MLYNLFLLGSRAKTPDPAQNLDADPDPDPDPGGGEGVGQSKMCIPPWQNPRYASGVGDPAHFGADPASFFIDLKLKDAKKNSYFFLLTCPQAHQLQYKKNLIFC